MKILSGIILFSSLLLSVSAFGVEPVDNDPASEKQITLQGDVGENLSRECDLNFHSNIHTGGVGKKLPAAVMPVNVYGLRGREKTTCAVAILRWDGRVTIRISKYMLVKLSYN